MRCNSGKCLILVMTIGLAAASAEGSQKPGSSDEGFRKGETRATPAPFLYSDQKAGAYRVVGISLGFQRHLL